MPSTLKREDQIDDQYQDRFNSRDLRSAEQSAGEQTGSDFDDIAKNYDQTADPAQENANIEKARQREEDGNQFDYQAGTTGGKKGGRSKALLKRFGPSGGILGLIFGGVFGIGVLFSPALAIVHLKEALTGDLNDQLTAMDMRTTQVFRAKMKDLGKSGNICKGMVQIRCGLKGMSDRQVKNFRNAGIEVETDGKTTLGKNKIKRLTFTSSTGEKISITKASEIKNMLIDRNIRSQIRRAYNPLFYGLWDKTAGKVFSRFSQTKAKHLNGDTDEERNKSVDESVKGEQATLDKKNLATNSDNEAENAANEKYNQAHDNLEKAVSGSSGFKGVFKGTVKGANALGTVDAACTVYNTSRMVEAGAKILRARQLVGFAMVFLNFADEVKAGTANPDDAEYIGNKLTAIDTQAKITDETSKNAGSQVDNPYYGKNAFDSEGAKAAFYNDAPNLTARAQQYMVGGAMVGTLASVNDKVASILGGRKDARKKCKVVQNPFVRGAGFIVGGIMAIGSFGWTTAASIGGSIAISMALPILAGYLKDMVAGTVVNASTEGVDAGNAIFSGTGVLLGNMAQARGMQPANESQIRQYQIATAETKQDIIATEVEDAKKEPLNIMNQYSFLGMFARKLLPLYNTGSTSLASFTLRIPSLLSELTPSVGASGDYNGERFRKCNDAGYQELGINADIFCNVRYIMTPQELAMNTDDVYKYMAQTHNYADPDTGEPQGVYADFIKECVDRDWGWGEGSSEESSDYGDNCIDGKSKYSVTQLRNFRVFTMDRSIEDGMDNGPETGVGGSGTGNGSSFRIATFNIFYSGGGSKSGTVCHGTCRDWPARLDQSVKVINDNNLDVVGLQEVTKDQWQGIQKRLGSSYDIYPKPYGGLYPGGNSIVWRTDKFDLVEGKAIPARSVHNSPATTPQVRLRDKSTGQEFYVINTHEPVDSGLDRYNSDLKWLSYIKTLSAENTPIFFTGDFNASYMSDAGNPNKFLDHDPNKAIYCMVSKQGILWDSYDASKKLTGECPTKHSPGRAGDHIFISKDVGVTQYGRVSYLINGSDVHDTVWSDVVIAGGSTSTTTQKGSDIAGDDYATECKKYVNDGYSCPGERYGGECVSFVKFRLAKHGVLQPMSLGTGGQVTATLKGQGFKVDTTPAVHSVMSLRHNSTGHTAMVSAVWPDGSITVEEYNWTNGHAYDSRKISKAQLTYYINKKIIDFAHTETKYK